MQVDGFTVLGNTYVLFIDELFRFKSGCDIVDHPTSSDCTEALMDSWLRFFGPMVYLVADQETDWSSAEMASVCDKFGTQRTFGGSDGTTMAHKGRRTTTGLVEKHTHTS